MGMMDIRIINYETRYLDAIRAINVAVSSHPDRPADEKELCRHLYIDYYAFFSKENCFVAVDEIDEVAGYIISEPDFDRYKTHMLEDYLPEAMALREDFGDKIRKEIAPYEKWQNEYDAHLHMDVKPGFQHRGIGTMLLEKMLKHLKEIGCIGVMLQVSKSNENANRFYEKNGLKIIDESDSYLRAKTL